MNIRSEIKEITSFINEETKNIRVDASELAAEFEKEFNRASCPVTIDDMDQRYIKKGEMYYLNDTGSKEGFKQILATGAVKVDTTIKTKLIIIERLYPEISRIYHRYKYVDEVWYLDIQSVGGGNTEKNIMFRVKPGFDIGGEYERGEKSYSRFGIIGPEQNPERKTLWSPDAFIELFDEFVISAQAPVYMKGEFTGKISIHYNLIDLRKDTIAKSLSNILIISNQFTLIGMSPSAKVITGFTQYERKSWDSKKAKLEYINNELNLAKQNEPFTDILKTLAPANPGKCEFFGKQYKLLREDIPEIGFQVLALI